jgi:predicted PurR-regulated permease PerM
VQLTDQPDRFSWFVRLATLVLVVALLRLGQDVLLPVAFAVLLAFLLSPMVVRLTRWGLPRTMAIVATVTIAFSVLGAVGWIVTTQVMALARELPNYEENIRQKITTLKHPHSPESVSRMAGMVESIRRELQTTPEAAQVPPRPNEAPKPVPVEVHSPDPTPVKFAAEIVSPVLRPLGIAGIVIVFVVAMLFQREDLRDRFLKLVSAGQLNVATQAIDDAAGRVSRYLAMQLVVNATYGIPIGLALYFIGIPNALLWGLLAMLLRFIPFVGPWIGAAFPVAVAIAVDPGWSKAAYTFGVFVVMEIITANVTEILLYGASTGISSLALLIAVVFWTWLWGPAGLVLSTPLTVCLLVLGNYVPGMNFVSMMLGSEPVLEPPAQFYQRMLSMESEDMLDLAAKHIDEHSLEDFYEQVFVPALLMSEVDRHSGSLPEVRQRFIFQASRELIEELDRHDEATATSAETTTAAAGARVIGLPARDEADEIVALALCHLLRRRGIAAAVNPLATPLHDLFAAIDHAEVRAIFISALPPSAVGAARQMSRRIKAHAPAAPVVVGVWQHRAELDELEKRLEPGHPTEVVTTLEDAAEQLALILRETRAPLDDGTRPPVPASKSS